MQSIQGESITILLSNLKSCGCSRDLEKGKALHAESIRSGDFSNAYVGTSLVSMYAKCKSLVNACIVFEQMGKNRTVATWNALMFGYVENGDSEAALRLFSRMQNEEITRSALTYVAALKACTSLARLESGMAVYSQALCHNPDIRIQNTLMDMYVKCGSMEDAAQTFHRILIPDDVSWNVLISGYADNGKETLALELFSRMGFQGVEPTSRTFVATLKACISLAEKEGQQEHEKLVLEKAMNIHYYAAQTGHDADPYVGSSLVDLYAKCCSMIDSRGAFDRMTKHDIVSYNALLFGYAENGEEELALQLYERMRSDGCPPNSRTFAAALKACIGLSEKEQGQNVNGRLVKVESRARGVAIHQAIEETRCTDIRAASTLIDLYARCGTMADARNVFDATQNRDVIVWNALLSGYADNGEGESVLRMFSLLQEDAHCAPDAVSYLIALKACGTLGALDFGRRLHSQMCTGCLDTDRDETLVATLVDFYGKCGSMVEAQHVFDSYSNKSLVIWTALMTGYSCQGNTSRVLELFQSMQDQNVQPDHITFLSVLTACCHGGLVEKGKEYFESMYSKFGIRPNLKHYTCILDMLGRANKMEEVADLLKRMPFSADAVTWTTILASCRNLKNDEIRKMAFDSLVSLGDKKSGAYIAAADS